MKSILRRLVAAVGVGLALSCLTVVRCDGKDYAGSLHPRGKLFTNDETPNPVQAIPDNWREGDFRVLKRHVAQSSTTLKDFKNTKLSRLAFIHHDPIWQLSPPQPKLERRHPGDDLDAVRLDTNDRASGDTFSTTSTSGWVIVIAIVFSTLFVILAGIRCLFLLRKTQWARNHGFGFPEHHNRTTLAGGPFGHLGEQGEDDYTLTDEMVYHFPLIKLDEKNIDHVCDFNFSALSAGNDTKVELCSPSASGKGFPLEKNLTSVVSTAVTDSSNENIREEVFMGALVDQPNEKVGFQEDQIKVDRASPSSIAPSGESKVEPIVLPSNVVDIPKNHNVLLGHDLAITGKYPVDPSENTTSQGDNHSFHSENSAVSSCSICLDEFSLGDLVRILPCHHSFHAHCIDLWLKSRHSHCPLCKFNCYFYLKDHYPELFPSPSTPGPHASTSHTFSSALGHSDNFSRYPPWLLFRRPQHPPNAIMYGGGFRGVHPTMHIPTYNGSYGNHYRSQDSTFVTVETENTTVSPGQPTTMNGGALE